MTPNSTDLDSGDLYTRFHAIIAAMDAVLERWPGLETVVQAALSVGSTEPLQRALTVIDTRSQARICMWCVRPLAKVDEMRRGDSIRPDFYVRPNQLYCSDRCRIAAHRSRKRLERKEQSHV